MQFDTRFSFRFSCITFYTSKNEFRLVLFLKRGETFIFILNNEYN